MSRYRDPFDDDSDDFEFAAEFLTVQDQEAYDTFIRREVEEGYRRMHGPPSSPLLLISHLVDDLSETMVQLGIASGAARMPYAPKEAHRDLRKLSKRGAALRRLVSQCVNEDFNNRFKESQQSSVNVLMAALAGSALGSKDPDDIAKTKAMIEANKGPG